MPESKFHVPAMDCPTEKAVITKRLAKVSGVARLDFDLLERVVTVEHEGDDAVRDEVLAALRALEMRPRLLDAAAVESAASSPAAATSGTTSDRKSDATPAATPVAKREALLLSLAGVSALAAEAVAWITGREASPLVLALAAVSLVTAGPRTLRKGLVAARTLTLNINLLMVIAVSGAVAIGQWPEAAMVTFLFAVAELIEARSTDRARDAIRSLLVLAPELTRVRRGDAWVEVATSQVQLGERISVRPGERIPLDGAVAAGQTSVDQAPITGESLPIDKRPGDPVFAGSVNQQGSIEVTVTAASGDTTLARIARAIREAQGQQAPTQRFVDRFARWYTPLVVLLALGVAFLPPLVFAAPLRPWLYQALVLLVIACPCALVISTPVTVVSGLAAAARRGLLVKGGAHLEEAHRLRVLALDKTGTLTEGKPRLTDVIALAGLSEREVLARAASLEAMSTHPLARAVTAAFDGALRPVRDARALEGKGIDGVICGEASEGAPGDERIAIGSHRFAEERGACTRAVEAALERLESEGKSVMVVWREAGGTSLALGVLGVADTVRATSVEAVRLLHQRGVRLMMLTGDNPTTAAAVAQQVGIDEVSAELMPEHKLARIDALRREGLSVGMVGDGVNDAPALARASLGFAMGAAGSDTALETADVALMADDLRGVPALIDLSRQTARTLRVNIAFALAVKAVFFALSLLGMATLWMAVFADLGASLLVAANGLRVLRRGQRG